jgi:hypothetical protein
MNGLIVSAGMVNAHNESCVVMVMPVCSDTLGGCVGIYLEMH